MNHSDFNVSGKPAKEHKRHPSCLFSSLQPLHLTHNLYSLAGHIFSRSYTRLWRPGYLSRYSDSLRAGRSVERIPVRGGGCEFFPSIQTGTGAHPASYTMGTGSFLGVKRPGRGADHPPPSKRRAHERVGLYLYSPSGPSWPVIRWSLPLQLVLKHARLNTSSAMKEFLKKAGR